MKCFLSVILSIWTLACVDAGPPTKPDVRDVIHKVRPAYPYIARVRHFEGHGVYTLHIRTDGSVSAVTIVQSTGHKILDDYAAAAYAQWRFRPGRAHEVQLPITFTMQGARE